MLLKTRTQLTCSNGSG